MRISTQPDPYGGFDTYNEQWHAGKWAIVYLNGEPVERCVIADEERGFVVYYGRARPIDRVRGFFPRRRKTGRVEIRLEPVRP